MKKEDKPKHGNETLGLAARYLRLHKGIPPGEMAAALGLTNPAKLTDFESGYSMFRLPRLAMLCDILGCESPDAIIDAALKLKRPPTDKQIAHAFATFRHLEGLNFVQIAEAVSIRHDALSDLERGLNQISIKKLRELSNFFGYDTLADFVDAANNPAEVQKRTAEASARMMVFDAVETAYNVELGNAARLLREGMNLSRTQLATRISSSHIEQRHYSAFEEGRHSLSATPLRNLLKLHKCNSTGEIINKAHEKTLESWALRIQPRKRGVIAAPKER